MRSAEVLKRSPLRAYLCSEVYSSHLPLEEVGVRPSDVRLPLGLENEPVRLMRDLSRGRGRGRWRGRPAGRYSLQVSVSGGAEESFPLACAHATLSIRSEQSAAAGRAPKLLRGADQWVAPASE